ncbi:hypothetical protein [Orenia marismortui]|uniref:Uncharacterized protein n=1 Tax=Orenia marismortui TaxID=46469 RepID=A0A4R8GYG6_9FIRM|nr:hypothetical protein [Orenia marismortui]TDX48924.1 hypothetical protein C7959_12435 [Orenia marismortui]
MTINGWNGTGYIVRNEDGTGAYMISGGLNGGCWTWFTNLIGPIISQLLSIFSNLGAGLFSIGVEIIDYIKSSREWLEEFGEGFVYDSLMGFQKLGLALTVSFALLAAIFTTPMAGAIIFFVGMMTVIMLTIAKKYIEMWARIYDDRYELRK